MWDYPRPPRLQRDHRHVQIIVTGVIVADSRRAIRVLETSSPPTFYIPPEDIRWQYFERTATSSICEWKGRAVYWSISVGDTRITDATWGYPAPCKGFEAIARCVSFYPSKVECRVGDRPVAAQPGGFYGGWVTPEIVGPFKGAPGSEWW